MRLEWHGSLGGWDHRPPPLFHSGSKDLQRKDVPVGLQTRIPVLDLRLVVWATVLFFFLTLTFSKPSRHPNRCYMLLCTP